MLLLSMRLLDVLAVALLVGSGLAFFSGAGALARSEDLRAIYWLSVGVASLRAAVQVARPGAKT